MAIIVLRLTLAIPAFNAMTGSKSIQGATNQLSAFLGRVRTEAIGLQQVQGVMFYIDPATDRVNVAQVVQAAGLTSDKPQVSTYLDVASNHDPIALPPAAPLQVINHPARTL